MLWRIVVRTQVKEKNPHAEKGFIGETFLFGLFLTTRLRQKCCGFFSVFQPLEPCMRCP